MVSDTMYSPTGAGYLVARIDLVVVFVVDPARPPGYDSLDEMWRAFPPMTTSHWIKRHGLGNGSVVHIDFTK